MHLPVVYVHGFIGHLHFPELREGLDPTRVISPDLLGYGHLTNASASTLSLATQVMHLEQVIEQRFGSEPVLLVGHSGGAAICVRFAQAYPARVAGFVSAEGNLAPSDAFLSSRLAPMSPTALASWLDRARAEPRGFFAQYQVVPDDIHVQRLLEWFHNQSAEVVHAMARSLLVETVHPSYAAAVMGVMAQIPTYLIHGERSAPGMGVPPRLSAMASGVRTIAGTGHMMVLEAPAAFAAAVRDIVFDLRDVAPTSRVG